MPHPRLSPPGQAPRTRLNDEQTYMRCCAPGRGAAMNAFGNCKPDLKLLLIAEGEEISHMQSSSRRKRGARVRQRCSQGFHCAKRKCHGSAIQRVETKRPPGNRAAFSQGRIVLTEGKNRQNFLAKSYEPGTGVSRKLLRNKLFVFM
jgi:hypothetical protein